MTQAIPKSRSRKVNGYVKAILALEAVRRKREDRYDRFVRPLDRKRDELAAEVATRVKALSGGSTRKPGGSSVRIPGLSQKRGGQHKGSRHPNRETRDDRRGAPVPQ